jgi:hypothetical protein
MKNLDKEKDYDKKNNWKELQNHWEMYRDRVRDKVVKKVECDNKSEIK